MLENKSKKKGKKMWFSFLGRKFLTLPSYLRVFRTVLEQGF